MILNGYLLGQCLHGSMIISDFILFLLFYFLVGGGLTMFPAACISFSCTILFYFPGSISSLYARLPFSLLLFFVLCSCCPVVAF
ncbi:hypothetical protein BDV09DRAFT_159504, partial [Aspergillus tetrazonus]